MEKNRKDIYQNIEDLNIDENTSKKDTNYKEDKIIFNIKKDISDMAFERIEESIKEEDFEEDQKEEMMIFNSILEEFDKSIIIHGNEKEEDKEQLAIKEILNIIKYNKEISPFKPLYKPKKVSMIGKVFYNNADSGKNNINKDNCKLNSNSNGK